MRMRQIFGIESSTVANRGVSSRYRDIDYVRRICIAQWQFCLEIQVS